MWMVILELAGCVIGGVWAMLNLGIKTLAGFMFLPS